MEKNISQSNQEHRTANDPQVAASIDGMPSFRHNYEEWLLTRWSESDLKRFDKLFTTENRQPRPDDSSAIGLIEETLSSISNDDFFIGNLSALETCYDKAEGSILRWIFGDNIFDAERILSLLKAS